MQQIVQPAQVTITRTTCRSSVPDLILLRHVTWYRLPIPSQRTTSNRSSRPNAQARIRLQDSPRGLWQRLERSVGASPTAASPDNKVLANTQTSAEAQASLKSTVSHFQMGNKKVLSMHRRVPKKILTRSTEGRKAHSPDIILTTDENQDCFQEDPREQDDTYELVDEYLEQLRQEEEWLEHLKNEYGVDLDGKGHGMKKELEDGLRADWGETDTTTQTPLSVQASVRDHETRQDLAQGRGESPLEVGRLTAPIQVPSNAAAPRA
ncbi:hypothetical protein QBC38DRAFT_449174 [Podospora fimiseda]|uniref:Uncharacterized protein n=1 Tax=Podospora fimiseda TaxID=252190 RepID=A0AAN6YRH9_9PEZI|nr:hypothetical protein QBC38DRAFT_449174 [Podospora fimiseda]